MKSLSKKLGVDTSKAGVRKIFMGIIDNEYPGAFVNIVSDPFNPDRVLTLHCDGDGSKTIVRWLHYHENSDPTIFRGIADDSLSMNTGDIAAAGFVDNVMVANILNIGLGGKIKTEIMQEIALRAVELRNLYDQFGISFKFMGGETADLPNQIRSSVSDTAVFASALRSDVIKGNVCAGDIIFGFPSDNQAAWETTPNFGGGSNGLTAMASILLSSDYNKKYRHLRGKSHFFRGRYQINDHHAALQASIGEAMLSPTRQWALVIKALINNLKDSGSLEFLHGITMNTGGGATKIGHLGAGGILYIKNMPQPLPPLFNIIQQESAESWRNMYQTFNCGIGLDIVGSDHPLFIEAVKKTAVDVQLPVYRIGQCQRNRGKCNRVVLNTAYGDFEYK